MTLALNLVKFQQISIDIRQGHPLYEFEQRALQILVRQDAVCRSIDITCAKQNQYKNA